MKRQFIKTFESYTQSLSEGVNWNDGSDIDIDELASIVDPGYEENPKAAIAKAKALMKAATPIPLTGKIKKDGESLIKLAADALKKEGIELDVANTMIDSSNFQNQIIVPIKGVNRDTASLEIFGDYIEMAYSTDGEEMSSQFSFYTYDAGNLDPFDVKNPADVKRAAAEVKEHF